MSGTMNWSEWSRERRTDDTPEGYRRTPVTSIDATRTVFSVAKTLCPDYARGARDAIDAVPDPSSVVDALAVPLLESV